MLYSQNVAPKAAPGRSLRAQQAPRATFHGRGAAPSLGSRQQSYRLPVSMMSDPRTESGREASSAPIAAPYSPQLPQMPPPPPRVQHSSAFLLRDVRSSSSSAAEAASAQPPPVSSSSENLGVVEWALRRADEELMEIEKSPTPIARAAWLLGRAASQVAADPAVQSAAKVTAKISVQVAKAVVPLGMSIGRWAIQAALPALLAAGEQERGGTVRKKATPKKK